MKIVILGGGTAGWMCAASLSALIATRRFSVELVESDEICTVGVGEATLPHIKTFNDSLGIDEAEFMRRTQATFKLGIEFAGWGRDAYIHPFGTFGQDWAGIGFHHHWLRAKLNGVPVAPIEDYSFAVAAARAGRFAFPDTDPASVKSTFAYAYHFDAALYAGFMRDFATKRGVKRSEGRVTEVLQHAETGNVTGLKLQSGAVVTGDLFLDCSGFVSLIAGKTLNGPWEDWSQWLPCDRAFAVPTSFVRSGAARAPRTGSGGQSPLPEDGMSSGGNITPYTRATAREAGWQWRIPLQHRTGNGYVFSSAFTDEERARDLLLANLDARPLADPKLLRFRAGRRTRSWSHNVVAVGLASGFLEPLESTSIYLVQAAIETLRQYLNGRPDDPRAQGAFNRSVDTIYDSIRDFLILHYRATERPEHLWQHVRDMALPDSLLGRIELFRHRGYIEAYRNGLFSPPSWLAVYMGQDVVPTGYDCMADAPPVGLLAEKLEALRRRIHDQVALLPSHEASLSSFARTEVA
jgi:tryptophan 7-halogenase